MTVDRINLNRFFRAVHDEVCPQCGGHIKGPPGVELLCTSCGLLVTREEMRAMAKLLIPDWGKGPVEAYKAWLASREPAQ